MKQRRTATALGAWLAAAALAVAVPNTAYAAHGILVIDGAAYQDPRGCLPLGDFVQPLVTNYTDSVVQVRAGTSCEGAVEKFVVPGESYAALGGRSVLVP
ncbi:hypothetical protein ADK60_11285 [Streptomyces sp. XY431]|uniref:hypothetical protein n=1 Tax=Streptomyces sp. XY431 TaxID=1415562 RepID=UPI0006AF90C4|nr:hypothetical protein [Streptomyces sp. XY431]KOV34519.1 hypothetical protein ADK60_11285 [Streptomyces sp. XY431]